MRIGHNLALVCLALSPLLIAVPQAPLLAQAPATVNHQGYLVDSDGVPFSGNFVLTFRLYDTDEAGTELWSEMHGLELVDGLFQVVLGSVEPLDGLPFDEPYWIGISINSGDELQPRLPLVSVPYSIHARTVADSSLTPAKFDPTSGSNGQVLAVEGDSVVWKDPPQEWLGLAGVNVTPSGDASRIFINRDSPIGVEWFGFRAPVTGENQWGGMYAETNGEGISGSRPFYGYAHNGESTAWHEFHGASNEWRLILRGTNGALTTQFKVDGDDGNVFADGTFNGGGADLAEAFPVEGLTSEYEPGDVLIVSTSVNQTVTKSTEPYSTLVAGVYATKPGVLLSENGIGGIAGEQIPTGVVGVIPTKVTSEGGPIRRGDLLVTSSLAGHAMKADPAKLGFGMVIGKALEPFEGDSGVIKVLVSVR